MTSKFSFAGYLPVILGLFLLFIVGAFCYLTATHFLVDDSPRKTPYFLGFMLLVVFWLFWGECRTKMIKVRIEGDNISVRRFGGLGIKHTYTFSEFDGFTTSRQPYGARGILEFLYLKKGNRKVIKISEAYHKNYDALKAVIQTKTNNLGYEDFSFLSELKEIFA